MANWIAQPLNIKRTLLVGVGIVGVVLPLALSMGLPPVGAQTPAGLPAFDAASVKPSDTGGNFIEVTPGTVNVHSATLATCIAWAYSLQRSQVFGADSVVSALLNSQRYDIVAKAGASVSVDEMRQMLQTLLADRFRMRSHRQTRDLQTFVLVVDKGGPKFHESRDDGDRVERAASKLTRTWARTSMAAFADQLSDAMESPVHDETGLIGKYDFALDLTPYLQRTGERPDIGAMMVTAVKEQLGLRLVGRRSSVEVLVIDHVEKASAD